MNGGMQMALSMIKYFSIYLGSFIIFAKSLHIRNLPARKWLILLLVSLIGSVMVVTLNNTPPCQSGYPALQPSLCPSSP